MVPTELSGEKNVRVTIERHLRARRISGEAEKGMNTGEQKPAVPS